MKKIILVASYVGRCGSSTIMRILAQAGLNIGNAKINFRMADKHNPFGYYDAYQQEQTIWRMFPEYYEFPKDPPEDVQLFLNRAQRCVPILREFFTEYFDDKHPLAIKDIRYFFLSVLNFYNLREYDVRVLVLHRPIENRLASGYAMIDDSKVILTKEQLKQWATAWKLYEPEILHATLNIPRMHLRFDDLIQSPEVVLDRMGDFLDMPLKEYSNLVMPDLRHH